jgi:hypothetical protein
VHASLNVQGHSDSFIVNGQVEALAHEHCPKRLIKLLWKTFATDEDIDEDTRQDGGPATCACASHYLHLQLTGAAMLQLIRSICCRSWRQMEKLDDKITAMLNCEQEYDSDSTQLPLLVSNINEILTVVNRMVRHFQREMRVTVCVVYLCLLHQDRQMRNVTARVDTMSKQLQKLQGEQQPTEDMLDVVPPPPMSRKKKRQATEVVAAFNML